MYQVYSSGVGLFLYVRAADAPALCVGQLFHFSLPVVKKSTRLWGAEHKHVDKDVGVKVARFRVYSGLLCFPIHRTSHLAVASGNSTCHLI